jgi:hypothetical protein
VKAIAAQVAPWSRVFQDSQLWPGDIDALAPYLDGQHLREQRGV